jgi:hypothetical protein
MISPHLEVSMTEAELASLCDAVAAESVRVLDRAIRLHRWRWWRVLFGYDSSEHDRRICDAIASVQERMELLLHALKRSAESRPTVEHRIRNLHIRLGKIRTGLT